MNTMYRNKVNNAEGIGGYDEVKKKFHANGTEILCKDNLSAGANLQNELCNRLSKEEFKKKDNDLETELEKLKQNIPNEKLFSKLIKSNDESINSMLDIFNKMPKGGLLHVHSTVGLSADELLSLIIEWNKVNEMNDKMKIGYYEGSHPQTKEGKDIPDKTLMYNVQSDNFINGSWIEINDANKTVLKGALYFNEPKNWTEFRNIFARTDLLFSSEEFYKCYHRKFFVMCIKNKIPYVEIRTGFQNFTNFNSKKDIKRKIIFLRPEFTMEKFFSHKNLMTVTNPDSADIKFLEQIKLAQDEAKTEINKETKKEVDFEVKVILTANRNAKMEQDDKEHNNVLSKMDTAIVIKNNQNLEDKIPQIIGFDLVAQEQEGIGKTDGFSKYFYMNFGAGYKENPSEDPVKTKKFPELEGNKRIELLRFFLHDGESMEIITGENDNAITGPICSRHRLGHGFKMGTDKNYNGTAACIRNKGKCIADYILYGCSTDVKKNDQKYPVVLESEQYKRQDGIAEPVIELCPISNQLLGYIPDLATHPAKKLVKDGIFAVISNDDPQIFDNPGLSYDYLMAYVNEILKYDELKMSVFLGYFYREMSEYYYVRESKVVDKEGRSVKVEIWVVNDSMNYGIFNDQIDLQKKEPKDVTEYAILNKAIERFTMDWKSFVLNLSME